MEGVESTSSVQNTQGPPQGPPQIQEQSIQPETVGSTSAADLATKFPNFKLSPKSKYTVKIVNGAEKIVFDQPYRKENEDGSPFVSSNDQLAEKFAWTVIEKKGKTNVAVAIAAAAVTGETLTDKKNFAYRMIYKIPGLISFSPRTIKGIQYFCATFDNDAHAHEACIPQVSTENQSKFALVTYVTANSPSKSFLVTVHDVPLDIDKPLFTQFLQRYGETESVRYVLRGLYYNVQAIYKDNAVKQHFAEWMIMYLKNSFRISHQDLTPKNCA